jgi:glycosyltransferase involved in cell wall biosynthesis
VTLRVGFDTTYETLSATGVGRYSRCLRDALGRAGGPEIVPLAAASRRAATRPGQILEGLAREGVWYPLLLERQARRRGCSLLHCPQSVLMRSGGLPLVVTVHDLFPLEHPRLFTRTTRAQLRASLVSLRRASRILTNTGYTRERVIEHLGIQPERVVVTPLGVGESFKPVEPDSDWLRSRFGIQGRFVLCVGALEPRKNLATALLAFERVAARDPDLELVVTGPSGWLNQDFERQLSRTKAPVRLTGFISDGELAALYSAAACFLYPSLIEGFGLPVLEALACGAPVVTSDRGGLPEVAGDAALLSDPDDAESVSDALSRALSDPELATDLRRRGPERAREFSWERCAELTAEVYREVAETARGADSSARS